MVGWISLFVAVLLAAPAAASDDLQARAKVLFEPVPSTPPVVDGNPATPAKIDLGAKLYFDPRLSRSQLISCNSCHNAGLAGVDLQVTSTGHRWQKGPRNAPTVFNSVYNVAQFWDGRAKDLAEQAQGPLQPSVEMNNNPEQLLKTLKSIPGYVRLFSRAFPADPDPVNFENVARAIEVFEATLITPDAPFDRYLRGNRKALGKEEQAGLKLFLDKGCAGCHGGRNVGGGGYYRFGVVRKPAEPILPQGDMGRFTVTKAAGDEYVFRAPSLRNVAVTAPYFHSGEVWSLQEAVRVMSEAQFGARLDERETRSISAFLATLNGKQPRIVYPLLPPNSEITPRPEL